MTTMSAPTPFETNLHIIGSGALGYAWYQVIDTHQPDDINAPEAAYADWSIKVKDTEEGDTYLINHCNIMRAIRRAATGSGKVSDACKREAQNFIFRRDDTDFDADTADQIIQLATFGEVVYG